MPNHPLFPPVAELARPNSLREQMQIALAVADPALLKSLLANSIPRLSQRHLIGSVAIDVGVPTQGTSNADAVLHYEAIRCTLAQSQQPTDYHNGGGWTRESKEFARLTRYESDTITLAQNVGLGPAVSLLSNAGFCPSQIEEILHLPGEACHKSWWYALDQEHHFTLPFLRLIRTVRYPDGTYTLQYKDYFEQDKPSCFRCQPQKVEIKIKAEGQSFGETLSQIKRSREDLGTAQAILICHTLSEMEAQAFINQGISIYPAAELLLPTRANCTACMRRECPMNGLEESPVAMCYGFTPSH